eukprot:TRINITY_DN54511_c0_g1_i1.p3 TRINITY_DN54511_c0_g1~~TRINITY_DN54511_c0_g1_i1.p3  ORF type:complete len:384 (-),score=63.42 TRINITY_DN54511_c0_g1_i1:6055-7206(-)
MKRFCILSTTRIRRPLCFYGTFTIHQIPQFVTNNLNIQDEENKVSTVRLLLEVDSNETIKEIFHIKTLGDLEKILKDITPENEGYLTWGEFVELLFKHKRTVKVPEEEIREKPKPILKQEPLETYEEENLNKYNITAEDYKKYYAKPKQPYKSEDPKITIPKPFSFERREKAKKKVAKQLSPVHEEKPQHFVANPIPVSTLLPKYEMIVAQNEARRLEVKQASYAMAKAREKPFSFYERDKEKFMRKGEEVIAEDVKPFKAKPVPPEVTVQLYEQMTREKEKAREERIKKRAEDLLTGSKLPPRMELDQSKGRPKKKLEESYPFRPEPARAIPDFQRQHEEFEKALEKHRKERQATVVEPFEFRETKVTLSTSISKLEKGKRE